MDSSEITLDPIFEKYASRMGKMRDLIRFAREVDQARSDVGDFTPDLKRSLADFLLSRVEKILHRKDTGVLVVESQRVEDEGKVKELKDFSKSLKGHVEAFEKAREFFLSSGDRLDVEKAVEWIGLCGSGDQAEFTKELARRLVRSGDKDLKALDHVFKQVHQGHIDEALEEILGHTVEAYYQSETAWFVLKDLCQSHYCDNALDFVSIAGAYQEMREHDSQPLSKKNKQRLSHIQDRILRKIEEEEETQLSDYGERKEAVKKVFHEIFVPESRETQMWAMRRCMQQMHTKERSECHVQLTGEEREHLEKDFDAYLDQVRERVYVEGVIEVVQPHLNDYFDSLGKSKHLNLLHHLQRGD